jgi:protein MpaA
LSTGRPTLRLATRAAGLAVGAVALPAFGFGCGASGGPVAGDSAGGGLPRVGAGAVRTAAAVAAARPRRSVFGHSVDGRPLVDWAIGDPAAPRRILVVGLIHGDEAAGLAVTRALRRTAADPGAELVLVDDLNPDGRRAATRQNARGVDLNRNFAEGFVRRGARGDVYYPGPGPFSEPETRAARRLIGTVRPTVTIWFHQHLDLVDESGGDTRIERRFARAVGLRFARLGRYPGSATGWQNARFPTGTAFVVELPAGWLSPSRTAVFVRGVRRLEPAAPAG